MANEGPDYKLKPIFNPIEEIARLKARLALAEKVVALADRKAQLDHWAKTAAVDSRFDQEYACLMAELAFAIKAALDAAALDALQKGASNG